MTHSFIAADADKCIGCRTCEIACVISHNHDMNISSQQFQPRLKVIKGMTITTPVTCKQCENAPCAQHCPTGAIVQKNNCIQVIQSRCIGCKTCVIACPFGAMTVVTTERMDEAEKTGKNKQYQTQAIKCDLCNDNPQGPACVTVCPTQALHLVEPRSLEQLIKGKQQRTAHETLTTFIQYNLSK
ncbi:MAG: 4Fe-4S dicluster domain-containing protein [Candidatus Schmidhempelia sp.]|nr:4Fe-4S dicluster domain-containing protein [Candidatus Schmidhempelia sp.]